MKLTNKDFIIAVPLIFCVTIILFIGITFAIIIFIGLFCDLKSSNSLIDDDDGDGDGGDWYYYRKKYIIK